MHPGDDSGGIKHTCGQATIGYGLRFACNAYPGRLGQHLNKTWILIPQLEIPNLIKAKRQRM